MKNDDVELIHRVLGGDDNAFPLLVEKYQEPIYELTLHKTGNPDIAEEITQDTFLKVHQKLGMLKEPQSFESWLHVIATHCCIDWLRKKHLVTEAQSK
jgi:RNA polymerase sigma-70 factor (ECF subfamily)